MPVERKNWIKETFRVETYNRDYEPSQVLNSDKLFFSSIKFSFRYLSTIKRSVHSSNLAGFRGGWKRKKQESCERENIGKFLIRIESGIAVGNPT